jgi:thiamine-monophosphate kinase
MQAMPGEPGEFELIAALRKRVESAGGPRTSSRMVVGSGDDAAVTVTDGAAVTSVDAVVEGVHFDRSLASPCSIGHKALGAALSDLAAMGAEPGEAYVQLALPADFDLEACLELADGLAGVAASHRVAIAGGDVSRAPALIVALTVVGYVGEPEEAVRRSGARPADVVAVTGELGGASAGLQALRCAELARGLDPEVAEGLRRRQLAPEPRLAAGRALASAGASAMIDVSDGLGADAAHIAAASGVAIEIDLDRLPIQLGVAEVAAAAGTDAFELAGAGGEDYELVVTLAADRLAEARSAVKAIGLRLTEIGTVSEGAGVELIDPAGAVRAPSGFDQLAPFRAPDARF